MVIVEGFLNKVDAIICYRRVVTPLTNNAPWLVAIGHMICDSLLYQHLKPFGQIQVPQEGIGGIGPIMNSI